MVNWVNLKDVVLWEDNPNEGDTGSIAEMIREFGFRVPIGWRDGNLTKSGNHRVMALRALQNETLPEDEKWKPTGPCIRVTKDGGWQIQYIDHSDLTEAQSTAFAIADNRAVRLGHDDMEKLATLLEAIYHDGGIDLTATGYDEDTLDEINKALDYGYDLPNIKNHHEGKQDFFDATELEGATDGGVDNTAYIVYVSFPDKDAFQRAKILLSFGERNDNRADEKYASLDGTRYLDRYEQLLGDTDETRD